MKRRTLFKSIAAVVGFNLLARNFSVTEPIHIHPLKEFEEWIAEASRYFWEQFYKERYDQLTFPQEAWICLDKPNT